MLRVMVPLAEREEYFLSPALRDRQNMVYQHISPGRALSRRRRDTNPKRQRGGYPAAFLNHQEATVCSAGFSPFFVSTG